MDLIACLRYESKLQFLRIGTAQLQNMFYFSLVCWNNLTLFVFIYNVGSLVNSKTKTIWPIVDYYSILKVRRNFYAAIVLLQFKRAIIFA